MVLIGLGALLVLGGILYMAHATIWRLVGPLAIHWSRRGAAWDSWGSERTGRAFSLWQSVPFCWCWGPASCLSHPPSCRPGTISICHFAGFVTAVKPL